MLSHCRLKNNIRNILDGQKPHDARIKGPFEFRVLSIAFVEVQFPFSLLADRLTDHLFQGDAAVLLILIVDDLRLIVRIPEDMLSNIDELDPLLFRGGFPPGEPSLIEGLDNCIQRVFQFFAPMNPAHIGILGIKLGIAVVQTDWLLQFYPFQAVSRQVNAFQQLIQRILTFHIADKPSQNECSPVVGA